MSTTITTRTTLRSADVTDLPTPEHLRASAALWSLRASLSTLSDREAAEDKAIADERVAAADPLKSPVWGGRQALGGHSDPTTDALLQLTGPVRENRFTPLLEEVTGQLANVAQHLPPAGVTSLVRIVAALPQLSKPAAFSTWQLADRIDSRIRRLLSLPGDRQYVPRVKCPWCDAVSLVMRLEPPQPDRVVECTTCTGAWLWADVAGARP
ncbi:hypothetical protein Q0Z83_060360 [Actinoplanes sichuanensis]|uniref:Transcription factor zinc-finger domain-containing protein n=1 Tax=Actinoplanes sichuanensis TaxID=512349 RepID=A0ABW4A600_9ACTN|nr:hypothetical protein [Actinoplanes sichuanensis]BEL07845.1 hypothetical protein Q0Z83_060360 [Actinoplanes sichuanensis]